MENVLQTLGDSICLWWQCGDWKTRAPEDGETIQVTVARQDDMATPLWRHFS